MDIKTVTRYRLEGVEYESLLEVKRAVENEIGKIIDSSPFVFSPKDRLAILNMIIKNHARLRELLSVQYDPVEELQAETVNIFDMDL